MSTPLQQMNIVIVGHVDHGKSTLIGRLLADTGSLPDGKLEQVKQTCERNSKPFEYAFLLDALKDEQAQGITIDAARCFFKSDKRHYIIIDAPGHIEFLKNMITGAARAEAALLLIDAKEGIQENSRRHGFMLSLLGIRQVVVLVNKMDLVDYRQDVFDQVVKEYSEFLSEIKITPKAFIPIAARDGENLISASPKMPWYTGQCVLDHMDTFEKDQSEIDLPFRFPVQDVYKFTQLNDDRRIVSGTVKTGKILAGEEVIFWPSGKKATIKTIEGFNLPPQTEAAAGMGTGFTMTTQLYVKSGEMMTRAADPQPRVTSTFQASLFWLGKTPMVKGKKYKLKLMSSRAVVYLTDIISVMNAAELTQVQKQEIERHEVANCVLKTLKPIACDLSAEISQTGRFVIIDEYEIAGGGIITEVLSDEPSLLSDYTTKRDLMWEKSGLTYSDRANKFGQKPKLVVLTGEDSTPIEAIGKALEQALFQANRSVYYLGVSNAKHALGTDLNASENREESIRRLGEVSHLFTDAGQILISTVFNLDDGEADILKTLNTPHDVLVIAIGDPSLVKFPVVGQLEADISVTDAVDKVTQILVQQDVLIEYFL